MGILANIFGTGDVVEKGIDLIDSFHTSDTEAIEARTKAKTDLLAAYAPFKIAQRVLAIMFGSVFLLCFLICLGAVLIALSQGATVIADDGSIQIPTVIAISALMGAFKLPWIMGTIVLFYFGGGAFEGVQARKAERDKIRAKSTG